MYIEGVLRRQAERWPSVQLRFGCKLLRYVVNDDGVEAAVEVLATGAQQTIRAAYLVGADGPRSLVREGLGIRYEGHAGEQREFMGGKMLAVYYRSQAWREVCCGGPAWQYWAINHADRGLICAIDGIDRYVFHTQLPQGESGGTRASDRIGVQALMRATGREFPVELIGTAEWTAGFALVAERYAAIRAFFDAHEADVIEPVRTIIGRGRQYSAADWCDAMTRLQALGQQARLHRVT